METMTAAIYATRVHLRLLVEDDLEMTLAWRNRDEVRRWFKQSDVISLESHRAWFTKHQLVNDAFMFVVEENATNAPVGQVSIYAIDREVGEAEAIHCGARHLGARLHARRNQCAGAFCVQ